MCQFTYYLYRCPESFIKGHGKKTHINQTSGEMACKLATSDAGGSNWKSVLYLNIKTRDLL